MSLPMQSQRAAPRPLRRPAAALRRGRASPAPPAQRAPGSSGAPTAGSVCPGRDLLKISLTNTGILEV